MQKRRDVGVDAVDAVAEASQGSLTGSRRYVDINQRGGFDPATDLQLFADQQFHLAAGQSGVGNSHGDVNVPGLDFDKSGFELQEIIRGLHGADDVNAVCQEECRVPQCGIDHSSFFGEFDFGLILRVTHIHQHTGCAVPDRNLRKVVVDGGEVNHAEVHRAVVSGAGSAVSSCIVFAGTADIVVPRAGLGHDDQSAGAGHLVFTGMEVDVISDNGDGQSAATCQNFSFSQLQCGVETLQANVHKSGSGLQTGTDQFEAVEFTHHDIAGSWSGGIHGQSAQFRLEVTGQCLSLNAECAFRNSQACTIDGDLIASHGEVDAAVVHGSRAGGVQNGAGRCVVEADDVDVIVKFQRKHAACEGVGTHDQRLTVGRPGQIKAVRATTSVNLQLRSVDLQSDRDDVIAITCINLIVTSDGSDGVITATSTDTVVTGSDRDRVIAVLSENCRKFGQ